VPFLKNLLAHLENSVLESAAKDFVVRGRLPGLCFHQALPSGTSSTLLQEAAWAKGGSSCLSLHTCWGRKVRPRPKRQL